MTPISRSLVPTRLLPLAALLAAVLLALLAAGCGDPGEGATPVDRGQGYYLRSCAACHGHAGEGRPGLGSPLADSEFIRSHSDDELVLFLNTGRQPNDPANTTGRIMPPKGGDPRLTDENLREIVAYLRTL